jgi:signal peptidase I
VREISYSPVPEPADPTRPGARRRALGCAFEIVETLVLTLLIFVGIQTFVAQPYQVKQQSMEQTLEPGEYVLVDKLSPRFDDYKRGDIVVFRPPEEFGGGDDTPFIKRVVGVGGDVVEIRDDGFVYVNDRRLEEGYLFGAPPTLAGADPARWVIPADEYFVMGDHRSNSADSRQFGTIGRDDVVGRAWLRYWPVARFGLLPTASPYPSAIGAAP